MTRTSFLTIALAMGLSAPVHAAPPADIPLTKLVADSEVVAVVTVTDKTEAVRTSVRLPHMQKAAEVWCTRYEAQLLTVLKADADIKSTASIRFIARSLAKSPEGKPVPPPPGLQLPWLDQGQKYIVMLQRLPGKRDLFLPDYYKRYLKATDANLRKVRAAIRSASKKAGTAEP